MPGANRLVFLLHRACEETYLMQLFGSNVLSWHHRKLPIIGGLSEEHQAVSERSVATEYERSKYLKRKSLGLCVMCGRKAVAGKTRCKSCSGKVREQRRARHPLYCGECGKLVTPVERQGRDGIRFHRACAKERFKKYPLIK